MCVQRLHYDAQVNRAYTRAVSQSGDEVRAIFMRDRLWPLGSELTVSFIYTSTQPKWYALDLVERAVPQSDMDIERKVRGMKLDDAVEYIVMQKVQPEVPGVTFKFLRDGTPGKIRVRLTDGGGASSLIGVECLSVPAEEHTITFGWMDVGTVMHEFSHALGMLHEHQNPRGGIQWNRPVVYEWAQRTQGWDQETTDTNILDAYSLNQITGSTFDPRSVMLYFFPPELTLNHQGTSQNFRYSATDKAWLNAQYPLHGPRTAPAASAAAGTSSRNPIPMGWMIAAIAAAVIIILALILKV